MTRTLLILQVLVSIIGAIYAFFLVFSYSFFQSHDYHDTLAIIAKIMGLIEIISIFLSLSLFFFLSKSPLQTHLIAGLLIICIILPFAERTVYFGLKKWDEIQFSAHNKERTLAIQKEIEEMRLDIEERTRSAQYKPYTGNESLDFLFKIIDSDHGYEGLPDYSDTTMLLAQQAFDNKLIDPNASVHGEKYQDLDGENVYSYIAEVRNVFANYYLYDSEAKNTKTILEMFIKNGANTKTKDRNGKTIIDYVNRLKSLEKLEQLKTAP